MADRKSIRLDGDLTSWSNNPEGWQFASPKDIERAVKEASKHIAADHYCPPEGYRSPPSQWVPILDYDEDIKRAIERVLMNGHAIALGRHQTVNAPQIVIQSAAWRFLALKEYTYQNYYAIGPREFFYDIRFFPDNHATVLRFRSIEGAATTSANIAEQVHRSCPDLDTSGSYRRGALPRNAKHTDYMWQALGELTSIHHALVKLDRPTNHSSTAWAKAVIKAS